MGGGILTSDEHSKMSEIDFKEHFRDESSLFNWYFHYLNNIHQLSLLEDLGEMVISRKAKNILSLGCGPAVLEIIFKQMFGDEIQMVVGDYDKYIIGRLRLLAKGIIPLVYDFYEDDPREVVKQYDIDTVILIGSACSMDDTTYCDFLKILRQTEVSHIYTCEAGIVPLYIDILHPFMMETRACLEYIFRRQEFNRRAKELDEEYSFHAFTRSQVTLKKIYRQSGFVYERLASGAYLLKRKER